MEVGANDLRVAAHAAKRLADALLEHGEVGGAKSAPGMLFQPGPDHSM